MNNKPTVSIIHHFSTIKDPRVNRQKKHELQDIFFITLCAVICGADNWVADLTSLTAGRVIAIDGKCLRRSLDKASKKAAICLVSAWAQHNSLVLGQVKVDDKSNEITAIPKLLSRLDIAGAVITLDAMGCQRSIAQQIIQQGGDYVLSLKGNQGRLHEDVATYFTSALSPETSVVTYDGEHGRIETRTARMTDDIDGLNERHDGSGLQSIIAVTSKRATADKVTEETRYVVSSLNTHDPGKLARSIRTHWAIENNLHWVLDIAFDEDGNRTRKGHSATNLAIIRHISLNLIKREKTSKVGVKIKRLKAGWNNDYLLRVMATI